MQKKIFIFLFFFITVSIDIWCENITPELLKKNDSVILKDLFTINVGIMKLKNVGKINLISPLENENITNIIKNSLESVNAVKLTKKASTLKSLLYLKSKLSDENKNNLNFLEKKIIYSEDNIDNSNVYQLFLEFQKNIDFSQIAKLWFENYQNPNYILKVFEPIERSFFDNKSICETQGIKDKITFDYLISGEIEKVEDIIFVNIFVYSYLQDKIISKFSINSNVEEISKNIYDKMQEVIPDIFKISYASLQVNTGDPDIAIFLNSSYMGKNNVSINFLLPQKYVLTLKKENYEDKIENIELTDSEKKEISLKIDKKKDLQIINFYIEPLGTKIFINSIYQGKTPFKKALPVGDYVISTKNDLYENYRYYLSITEVKNEEEEIYFHLKSKDIKNYLKQKKGLYYTAFWNFTFSLITTVPVIVFATSYQIYNYDENTITEEGKKLKFTYQMLYGFSWGLSVYSVLSLGWLFYSLFDYLLAKEKQDFIPIIEFYEQKDGKKEITLGIEIKLK